MNEDQIDQIKELMLIGYTIGAALEKLGIEMDYEEIVATNPHTFMGQDDEITNTNN